MIGGKDVAELSGILVPSTLTGINGATPGTAISARPGGNDSTLLAEALTMANGEDDGGCKGAING